MGMLPASNVLNRSVVTSSNNTVSSSRTSLDSYFNTLSLQTPPENTSSVIGPNEIETTTSTTPTTPKSRVIYSDYCFRLLNFLNKKDASHLNQVSKDQNIEVSLILNETHYPTYFPEKLKLNGIDMIQEATEVPSTQRLVNDAGQWDAEFVIHCLEKTKSNESYIANIRYVLRYAASEGDMTLLKLLKQRKLINTKDDKSYDSMALNEAAVKGHVKVLRFLKNELKLTAENVRIGDNVILRYAAQCNRPEVLRFLKNEFGLTADDARAQHNTALKLAARHGLMELLYVLKNDFGLTAIDARRGRSDSELISFFEDRIRRGYKEVVDFYKNEWGLTLS